MTTYMKELEWRSHPQDFDYSERRILLALSDTRGEWLTVGALRKSVDLRESEFGDALASLMKDGIVVLARTNDWDPVLGLAERVGSGPLPVRDRRKAATS